jgi:hypothetical protein
MQLSNWHHHLVTTSGTKAEASSLESKTAMPMKKWKHMICYFSPHRSREKRAPPWTHNASQYPRPPPLAHVAHRGVEPSFVHPSTPCQEEDCYYTSIFTKFYKKKGKIPLPQQTSPDLIPIQAKLSILCNRKGKP